MRTPYTSRKEFEKDLPEFDPNKTYTERELELYTNQILRADRNDRPEGPRILFQEHIEPDWRREVSPGWDTADGRVDSIITNSTSPDGQRMYNRQHPQGRKVNSEAQRTLHGASYYR